MKRRTRKTLTLIESMSRGYHCWLQPQPLPPARLVLTKSNSVRKRKRRYRRNKRKSP